MERNDRTILSVCSNAWLTGRQREADVPAWIECLPVPPDVLVFALFSLYHRSLARLTVRILLQV